MTHHSLTLGQLEELCRTTTDADVLRACLVALGDGHLVLTDPPSAAECAAADAACLRAWEARNAAPSEATPIALARADGGVEIARLRARWEASRPFVEVVALLWGADLARLGGGRTVDPHGCQAAIDAAIGRLGTLAATFTGDELTAMTDLVGEALRGGREVDALLERSHSWVASSDEEIDRDLREAGGDPDAIDRRGEVLVGELLRTRRERSGVYASAPGEPDITDEEILDLYYIASRDNDPKVQTLCEVARGDGEVTRRIARQALAPLAAKRRPGTHGK